MCVCAFFLFCFVYLAQILLHAFTDDEKHKHIFAPQPAKAKIEANKFDEL